MSDNQKTGETAFRRQLVQDAEPGSFAQLALERYDEKMRTEDEERVRRAGEQQQARERWATAMEKKHGPKLTEQLAAKIRLPADHPALVGLRWYIDRENLRSIRFTTPPEPIEILSGDKDATDMFADVAEDVLIRVHRWWDSNYTPVFAIVHTTSKGSSTGISDLSDIGKAIAEQKRRTQQ